MTRRLKVAIITGSILGVFCIIGATTRSVETLSGGYLFAFWFNRVIMGIVIGLITSKLDLKLRLVRGLGIGLFVSLAFYSATEFNDVIGFLTGGIYGIIIEYITYKFER